MSVSKQKQKGTKFESAVVNYLKAGLGDEGIERRALGGTNDRGDIAGVSILGHETVLECKNCTRLELAKWIGEAQAEQGNADADFSFVVFKRAGKGEANMGEQYVLCTLENLRALIALGPENVRTRNEL